MGVVLQNASDVRFDELSAGALSACCARQPLKSQVEWCEEGHSLNIQQSVSAEWILYRTSKQETGVHVPV